MNFDAPKKQLAFSLIEIPFALASGSILGTSALAAMIWQSRQSFAQSEAIDVHQRARTIINFLQSQGRSAGFGYSRDPNAGGDAAVGLCTLYPDPTIPASLGYPRNYTYDYGFSTAQCTKVDQSATADRLRFIYLDPWLFFYTRQSKQT